MDRHIEYANIRQPAGEVGPLGAATHRNIESELRSQKQQTGIDKILANDMGVPLDRIRCDRNPGLAESGRPRDMRFHVPGSMSIESGIRRGAVVMTRLDTTAPCAFWKSGYLAGGIGPCLSSIHCYLEIPIVGAGPDHAWVFWRFTDRNNRAVVFRRGIVDCQSARFLLLLLLRVVCRQVAGELFPRLALIGGPAQILRACVYRTGVVGAWCNRCVPVEPEFGLT